MDGELSIQKIDFQDLSPRDKLSKVMKSTVDYISTVKRRIDVANVSLLTGKIAEYNALDLTSMEIGRIVGELAVESIIGTSMLSDEPEKAIAAGFEASQDFISRLDLFVRMSPHSGALSAIKDFNHEMNEEQLRLARQCAEIIIDRFPDLSNLLKQSGKSPDIVVSEYFEHRSTKKYKAPEFLSYIAWFLKDMQVYEELLEENQLEKAIEAYGNAHMRKHQMMEKITEMAISIPEQKVVKAIVDFEKSGPKFIEKSSLIRMF